MLQEQAQDEEDPVGEGEDAPASRDLPQFRTFAITLGAGRLVTAAHWKGGRKELLQGTHDACKLRGDLTNSGGSTDGSWAIKAEEELQRLVGRRR